MNLHMVERNKCQWEKNKCYVSEFSHWQNKILLFVTTWMDLMGIVLSEISQTNKDSCQMISLTYGILRKNTGS